MGRGWISRIFVLVLSGIFHVEVKHVVESFILVQRVLDRVRFGSSPATSSSMTSPLSEDLIKQYIEARTRYRQQRQFKEADDIKALLESQSVELIDDLHYVTKWRYRTPKQLILDQDSQEFMDLCHNRLVNDNAENDSELVEKLLTILEGQRYAIYDNNSSGRSDENCSALSNEMHGRKYADAAYTLSLAGVTNEKIFTVLADGAASEFRRCGHKKTCQVSVILQIIEKLAMAGIRSHPVYIEAARLLAIKDYKPTGVNEKLLYDEVVQGRYSLLRKRPLLWLWRYASKQKKSGLQQRSTNDLKTAPPSFQQFPLWSDLFKDPNLPLVVDLGCGFGVATLGMADNYHSGQYLRSLNFLGVDMNKKSVNFAKGIASRWNMSDNCAFIVAESKECLEHIASTYPGTIQMVMINFPTPYSLETICNASYINTNQADIKMVGNQQLPNTEEFLFNSRLIDSLKDLYRKKKGNDGTNGAPILMLQTNAEDVAISVFNSLETSGDTRLRLLSEEELACALRSTFECAVATESVRYRQSADELEAFLTERDKKWIQLRPNSCNNRAAGVGFLRYNPLPGNIRTETEVACQFNQRPVHRLIYVYRDLLD